MGSFSFSLLKRHSNIVNNVGMIVNDFPLCARSDEKSTVRIAGELPLDYRRICA